VDRSESALQFIETWMDPDELKQLAANAGRAGQERVTWGAEIKLFALLPTAQPGTCEHDVWQSIHALEAALKAERGKTIRLTRTRQKIARVGEWQTVHDLVNGKPSDGFDMLIERGMPEPTFEVVALCHPDCFDDATRRAAETRLAAAEAVA
jgi:hypothetical protein